MANFISTGDPSHSLASCCYNTPQSFTRGGGRKNKSELRRRLGDRPRLW
jgi:hypothetical protein